MSNIESLDKLVALFTKLPGVGLKTAQRYAYSIINMDKASVEEFASSMIDVKEKIHYCKTCGNYTDLEECEICQNRDKSIICVVKDPKDVAAFEKVKEYKGVYHVLHGTLSPLANIGPNDIRIGELLQRLDNAKEVIIATNPDPEGEATAMYIARLIKPLGIKVSRLASGVSIGSEIEYADAVTLQRALKDRKDL